uniref:interleukin-17A-like n=1 Tax=Pristiophorus japonicus TaxID=55135 RepID=UPI00398EA9D1
MLCKVRPRSRMASAALVIVLLAILAEVAPAAKVRDTKRKREHPRLRRTTKCPLHLTISKLPAHSPSHHWGSLDAGFRNRSLSPWIYKEDFDANRYPSSIFKAECVSMYCKIRNKENLSFNTRLVNQEMIVLRREKASGPNITYHVTKMMVPVACVCVHAEVVSG